LSKNLREIGISDEQFVAAVASGSQQDSPMARVIFGQVLAVDDFLTFKKVRQKQCNEDARLRLDMHRVRNPSPDTHN
jgi:hypothetical protein